MGVKGGANRFLPVVALLSGLLGSSAVISGQAAPAASAMLEQAKALRRSGKPEEARLVLEGVVASDPANFLAQYNLGLTLAALGRNREAVGALDQAQGLRDEGKIPEYTIDNSLGWARFLAGDYAGAERSLRLAEANLARLDKDSQAKVLNNLGLVLLQTGRYEEARPYFEKAAGELDSGAAEANLQRLDRLKAVSSTSGWYVILGSFPKRARREADERLARCESAGLQARVVDSDQISGFTPGLWVVVDGPFPSRSAADPSLEAGRGTVKDAYLKFSVGLR